MHCVSGRYPVDLVAVKSGNFEKIGQGILFTKIIGNPDKAEKLHNSLLDKRIIHLQKALCILL